MDHAAYGVDLLFGSRQMIRRFTEENTWDDIIREAILRHSRYEVGDGMDSPHTSSRPSDQGRG